MGGLAGLLSFVVIWAWMWPESVGRWLAKIDLARKSYIQVHREDIP